jgi:hypothetical protein
VDRAKKEIPRQTERSLLDWLEILREKPCNLHPKKLSEKCRSCKSLKEAIDDFKTKEEESKKKNNLPALFANSDKQGNTL